MFGSAIALRLFLFLVPVMLVVVGVIGAVLGTDAVTGLVHVAGIGGTIAAQLNTAARSAHRTYWVLLGFGIVLTPWAGRGLIQVLTACAAGAWRINRRDARTSLRSVGAVIALLTLMLIMTFTLDEVRAATGIVASTAGLITTAIVLGTGWFAVTWSLPRGTVDPGALLPGAALVGTGLAALQWFMQFYLPDRISRSSDVMGSLGLSIAILGCMFLAGRLLASSLVLDAVVFERFGSISGIVFGLPGLRRLPARFPRLHRFFALDPAAPADVQAPPPFDTDAVRTGSER